MVRKSTWLLLLSASSLFGQFVADDVNRSFVALQNKAGRGLVKDQVYQITSIDNDQSAQHTGGGVGIRYSAKESQWTWLHNYTENQEIIDCIAFASGISLFLIFAKGFQTSFA